MKDKTEFDKFMLRKVLKLQWLDLSDEFEIVLVEDNPHRSSLYGWINLERYLVAMPQSVEPIEADIPEAVPYCEFIAHRRRVDERDIIFLLIDTIDGMEYFVKLFTPDK